jgi:hypothetical protein
VALALAAVVTAAGLAGCSSGGSDPSPSTTTEPEVTTTTSTTEPPVEAGQVLYVYSPTIGECFDRRRLEPDAGGERVVLLLDCEVPHTFEVFGTFEFDDTALGSTGASSPAAEGSSDYVPSAVAYPGQDPLIDAARRTCPPLFTDWVGTPYEVSVLEFSWVLPDEDAWARGIRTIGCALYDPTVERMTGTTRNAQR